MTRRGSAASVIRALATGFLAFPYQPCLGTAAAFATCLVGNQRTAGAS